MTALLPPGARIGIVAPSHAFFEDRYQQGLSWLRARGYQIVERHGIRSHHRYFAGSDDLRSAQLIEALCDPDLDAVWAARGGSGITRLLDRIPYTQLLGHPVIGFSDLTPLLDQLALRGLPAVHGPVVHSLGQTSDASLEHLGRLLDGAPLAPLPGQVWVDGEVHGPLVGGNLCLLAATCGTPAQLDASGAIVVLEEIGEAPYKIDRMLQQLKAAGVLRGVAGIALGRFTGCDPPSGAEWTLRDLMVEQLGPLGVPILADLPIGHGPANHAFRVRSPARLSGGALHLGSAPDRATAAQ